MVHLKHYSCCVVVCFLFFFCSPRSITDPVSEVWTRYADARCKIYQCSRRAEYVQDLIIWKNPLLSQVQRENYFEILRPLLICVAWQDHIFPTDRRWKWWASFFFKFGSCTVSSVRSCFFPLGLSHVLVNHLDFIFSHKPWMDDCGAFNHFIVEMGAGLSVALTSSTVIERRSPLSDVECISRAVVFFFCWRAAWTFLTHAFYLAYHAHILTASR
jgi:hypothetical protein